MTALKKKHFIPLGLLAIQAALLVVFAFTRLVDGDEGFYLSAALAVSQGKAVYADFFYPQMPYLPHIFSFLAGHGFVTLYLSRLLSVLAAIGAMLLFWSVLRKITRNQVLTAALMAAYAFSGLIVSWHSTAKTFAFTDMLLMTSFVATLAFIRSRNTRWLMLSGVAMAIAVNIRLIMFPFAVIFLLPILISAQRERLKRVAAYVLPLIIFSLPGLIMLAGDPRRFMFNNLGFHFMRNPGVNIIAAGIQKLWVIGKLLINPQMLLIVIAAAAVFLYWKRTGGEIRIREIFTTPTGLAAVVALALIVIYILPNPIHQQYFVQPIPFALLAIGGGMDYLLSRRRENIPVFGNRKILTVLMTVYILGMIPYFVVYIGAVRDCDGHYALNNMKQMCACLNQTDDEIPIIAEMPMITVLCNKPTIDGLEFMGFEYPLPLDDAEKTFYHLPLNSDLKKILDAGDASYYVVVNDPPDELQASAAANYDLLDSFERFKVYRRKS